MTRDTRGTYTMLPVPSSASGSDRWHRRVIAWLGRGRATRARAAALYTALVEQARQPAFYAQWSVPDSRDGRLEMVSLHVILVLRRLRTEGVEGRGLAQAVLDRMFEDLDRHLREWGVGDPSVGKRMKELAGSFLGRFAALEPLLVDADPGALAEVLRRNVYSEVAAPPGDAVVRLALYLRAQERWLAAQDGASLLDGQIRFGSPDECG